MNRRSFLQAILAASVAPAVVGSGILMPVRAIALPEWGVSICAMPPYLKWQAERNCLLAMLADSMVFSSRRLPLPPSTGGTVVFRRAIPWERVSRIVAPSSSSFP